MSERKVTPSRPEICPVHPTGDNKYSKPIFGFFRKRPSSKAPSKVEQEEMEDKENQSSSQQQIKNTSLSTETKKLDTPSKETSPLQDYKRASAANSTQKENTENGSIETSNTLRSNKSKSFKGIFKSLKRKKSTRKFKSKDVDEEKLNTLQKMFSDETNFVHTTGLPCQPDVENKEEVNSKKCVSCGQTLEKEESDAASIPSTSDTVRKLNQEMENIKRQLSNPYDFVYNNQNQSLMEDSLSFGTQTNKNMIDIYNILAKETFNPTYELSNGYVLGDLSEKLLSMLIDNNKNYSNQITIYKDKVSKQDKDIFYLKLQIANSKSKLKDYTLNEESLKETNKSENECIKTSIAVQKEITLINTQNKDQTSEETVKMKQLQNSLKKLEESNAKLVISHDAMKKEKSQLEKQKEFLTCYKNNSINFMSYLSSNFYKVVDKPILKEYSEYIERFKTNDSLTNSMIYQTSQVATSKGHIEKFFNEVATKLIKDTVFKINESNKQKDLLKGKLKKSQKVISTQEKQIQEFDKNYQVALNPNISRSSVFVTENYSDRDEPIPDDPLLGP